MKRRIYEELRSIVENEGGTMEFERKGAPQGGKWIVLLDGKTSEFHSNGAGFPELDNLYKPRIENPRVWQDYSLDLIPSAKEIFLRMIR